ncbi:MAG: amidohydrolase, partial [Chitinophagaceae bacterium]
MTNYKLVVNSAAGPQEYTLNFKEANSASLIGKDTVTSRFYYDGRQVRINVAPERRPGANLALSGIVNENAWSGTGTDAEGNRLTWTATYIGALPTAADSARARRPQGPLGAVTYPFLPFGWSDSTRPKQETILIRNTTVWTSEDQGVLANTDVLIAGGKISAIGKGLPAP